VTLAKVHVTEVPLAVEKRTREKTPPFPFPTIVLDQSFPLTLELKAVPTLVAKHFLESMTVPEVELEEDLAVILPAASSVACWFFHEMVTLESAVEEVSKTLTFPFLTNFVEEFVATVAPPVRVFCGTGLGPKMDKSIPKVTSPPVAVLRLELREPETAVVNAPWDLVVFMILA